MPAPGTWQYHALLLAVGMLVLGPLGGVAASYMNFSLGFFIGGQVLAGILGSTVTLGYGPEGRHGANYMQTAAASVASLSAMGVLIQAMVWMGLPEPPAWQLVLYLLCIGMFAAGLGMLYTPILVDRMKLTYPSGLAVANILRALSDPELLRRSIAKLGSGIAAGIAAGIATAKVAAIGVIEFSASTFGAGMVVGARIGIPAITSGLLGAALVPWFVSIGWLQQGDPARKITFLIALGLIIGAAAVDLALVGWEAARRYRERGAAPAEEPPDWKRVNRKRLWLWVGLWALAVVATGRAVLGQPVGYLVFAIALCFVFVLVNGISVGLTDSNPISSAFVVAVILMALAGLTDPVVGLMTGAILLVSCNTGVDMQQDRSTGWRLGSNRILQFRYQVAGVVMGAILGVAFAKLFMAAYPVLHLDQTVMKAAEQPANWTSAMTYKFVGVLRSLTDPKPHEMTAMLAGIALGFAIEVARKAVKANAAWRRFRESGRKGFAADFALDAIVLPSPYAFSFGGFVNLMTSIWFGLGGVISSLVETLAARRARRGAEVPPDMSATSLVGGGLIAGDALAALGIGLAGLALTLSG